MNDISELSHVIPPQQERSTQFLRRVLEAAERILRREGGEGLTMPAVALEAGVSVGGIYRRFQTKQDLLRAIKDRHLTRSEQAMDVAMAGGHQSLRDVVEAFVATLMKGSGADNLFGLIMESQGEDPVMKARGDQAAVRLKGAFAAAMQPFRAQITHADPDAAIDMAYLIALSLFTKRSKGKAVAKALPAWGDMRRETVRAMIGYLEYADRRA